MWRVATVVLVVALGAGCGRSPVAGGQGGTSRSGCAAGQTPLLPRTLAQDSFTGLAWNDGAVVATSLGGVTSFPLDGSAPAPIVQMRDAYGLVLAGGSAFFEGTFPVGQPNAQGKVSSGSGLFSVPLSGGVPTLQTDAFLELEDRAVSDGTAIYAPGVNNIVRIAAADGARSELPLPTAFTVDALAVHAGTLYVAAQDGANQSATNGVIVSLPVTGGPMKTLAENIGHPWTLIADASGLYWEEDPPTGQFTASHVVRTGLDGKGKTTLLDHGARSLVVSDGALYVAMDGLSKVPLAGGDEVPLVTGLQGPGLLVVSDGNAAWIDPEHQALSATTEPSLMTVCW